jgi:hypothetical protein
VASRKHPDDVVVDADALAVALGSPVSHNHPDGIHMLSVALRRDAIERAVQGRLRVPVWIVSCWPNPRDVAMFRSAGASFVVVDPGMDVCLERATGTRPDEWPTLIRNWYADPPDIGPVDDIERGVISRGGK